MTVALGEASAHQGSNPPSRRLGEITEIICQQYCLCALKKNPRCISVAIGQDAIAARIPRQSLLFPSEGSHFYPLDQGVTAAG